MDIDGVITDGSVLVSESGKPLRNFNEKDGFALRLAATQGYRLACITGGSLEAVRVRMKAYGVPAEDVYMHSCNKIADFRLFCEKYGLAADEVLYMGDDLPDLPVIMAAGAFIQGSSIELSADGPMKEPYIAYMQGGITYESGKLGIMMAVSEMLS